MEHPNWVTMRLHMGEMTPYEVMIAQAAVRFAHSRLSVAHAAELAERDARIERLFAANEQVMARAEAAERDARAKQSRIDALMLEYCPEDMTPEQVAAWKGAIATTEQDHD